ncbi:MAG: helix-turn-helix domain-containing protein, partial [Anaerolineae bacterium]
MILQSYEAEVSKMPGPKPAEIHLTDEERQGLEELVNRHTAPQQVALRARIVLAAADGKNNAQIARELKIGVITARRWRNRWLALQPIPLADLSV